MDSTFLPHTKGPQNALAAAVESELRTAMHHLSQHHERALKYLHHLTSFVEDHENESTACTDFANLSGNDELSRNSSMVPLAVSIVESPHAFPSESCCTVHFLDGKAGTDSEPESPTLPPPPLEIASPNLEITSEKAGVNEKNPIELRPLEEQSTLRACQMAAALFKKSPVKVAPNEVEDENGKGKELQIVPGAWEDKLEQHHQSSGNSGSASLKLRSLNSILDTGSERNRFVEAAESARQMCTSARRRSSNVTLSDYYKSSGLCQRVARNFAFENSAIAIIFLNAIWIAVDTDKNDADLLLDADPVFIIMENLFCTFFVTEWLIRISAVTSKRIAFSDWWFVFDTILVIMMVLETWVLTLFIYISSSGAGGGGIGNASILRIARLMRLTRMTRMARLLRAVPELFILVKGMLASMRSVLTTLFLLVIILYVFGIALTQLTDGTPSSITYFPDVATSMYTLLLYGVLCLDYVEDIANSLSASGTLLPVIFFLFVLLAALTVMNMLIGVLCEIVSEVARTEKEELMVNHVRTRLEEIYRTIDKGEDSFISREKFTLLMKDEQACAVLNQVGVDVAGLVDWGDIFFESDQNISFAHFTEMILQLRGTNSATVRDVIELRKLLRQTSQYTVDLIKSIDEKSVGDSKGLKSVEKTPDWTSSMGSVQQRSSVLMRRPSLGGANTNTFRRGRTSVG